MKFLRYIVIVAMVILCQCTSPPQTEIYIATTGSDEAVGTQQAPVATLAKAIELARQNDISKIVLTKGRHQLDQTLEINYNTGDSLKIVGENEAIISGGVEISDFQKVEGNLYVADVKHLLTEEFQNLRQLFKNGKRLPRAQTPNGDEYFFTNGQVEKYKDVVEEWNFPANGKRQKENPEIHTGFAFKAGDIKAEWNEPYVELLMHHSWESSWQTIRNIDVEKNEIFMNTPSVWPVGFFGEHGGKLRYKLFNHKAFIDQPNEWMVDPEEGKLYYLAPEGEEVANMTFVLPVVKKLMLVSNASKVTFDNITFSHSDYAMGIYNPGVHPWEDTLYNPSWGERAKQLYEDWPEKFYPGYSEPQAAVNSGETIKISESDSITFTNCTFKGLGANAIWVREKSSYVSVVNSIFDDTGAGAIKIGTPRNDIEYWNLLEENMAHHNLVKDCKITNGGKVFAGGVGIWIGQSYDNLVQNNEIYNYSYSGISLGWNWNKNPNHTKRNKIIGNTIHDIMQVLVDGGGIYTLGILEDCVLEGNEIYNVFRPDGAAGSNSNGIFFDEATTGLIVKNNYIHDILNAPIRFNQTHHGELKEITNNYFDVDYIPVKYNNNYNMDFDEKGFMRVVIEDNNYGVKEDSEWREKYKSGEKDNSR